MKKLVAIGGGQNGRILPDGTKDPYETKEIDEEIIRLTGKEHPNFLFIGHAQLSNIQKSYFETMKRIYGDMFGCSCKMLKSKELRDEEKVQELIEWADIIYEGGGNTLDMIRLWKDTGFDEVLKKAWESGKVICGLSAGACCWFKECLTDAMKILYGDDQPFIVIEGLGFFDGLFTPHCDLDTRYEDTKNILKEKDIVGLLLSNCSALEIIDDEYKLITSSEKVYGLKAYYLDGKYYEEKIDNKEEFKKLKDLLSKK